MIRGSRWYDVTFRAIDGTLYEVRVSGNTRRSAERAGWRALRREHRRGPDTCSRVEVEFVGSGDRFAPKARPSAAERANPTPGSARASDRA